MNEEQRLASQQLNNQKKKKTIVNISRKYLRLLHLKDAKKRGKEEVKYHKDFDIEEKYLGMGQDRKFYIRTYGCQMNEHDTEVMAGIFMQLGYTPTESD